MVGDTGTVGTDSDEGGLRRLLFFNVRETCGLQRHLQIPYSPIYAACEENLYSRFFFFFFRGSDLPSAPLCLQLLVTVLPKAPLFEGAC